MTDGHLVSIVIPALNEEQALSACLDSVLGQTHRELEVLVLDGGSTDRTRELVAQYQAVDDRVRLIENPGRIAPAALNVAVRAMRSDWLLRVDGHTDKQRYHGRLGTNWELSSARAIAVVKFLIDQGIPPNRLVAAGFAEFRPLADGDSPDDLRRNRRIELKLDQL